MNCEQCNKEYESKRSTSKYCSAKCRKLAFHSGKNVKDENAKPGTIGTVNPLPSCLVVTPEGLKVKVPSNYGLEGCTCLHCKQDKGKHIINHGEYKRSHELVENEINRVSLPGDVDYVYARVCDECKGELVCAGSEYVPPAD